MAGASILLFCASGVILWWRARCQMPKISRNTSLLQADVLLFVASEGGSTWGFAHALHQAFVRNGHRVHTTGLEKFDVGASARHIFVLAATYGDGQAPAHASQALERVARQPVRAVPVTVLGFGDRQFAAFCAYAEAIEQALRARGWPQVLPLERIHQQSAQQFARWGEEVAQALGEPLLLDYVPRIPRTTSLVLVSRQDYPGAVGEPTTILRFESPARGWLDRLMARGLPRFKAGELLGIVPPDSAVPRYYSLASTDQDGFLEICVRRIRGGVCSTYLHQLKPGDTIDAFVKSNPAFALEGSRQPVVLIGAGTGVAPLAGFIRANGRRIPMHLYYGARDPALDFYFSEEIQAWLRDRRLASLQTAFSRTPDGGGRVQDALRRDAARLCDLVSGGAVLRVCGSRPMAKAVAEALDGILGAIRLSVEQLKAGGRYAEDVF
jgi:sulfite reductase (NADPH) flavoprotein alpha-component